jgi:integrase
LRWKDIHLGADPNDTTRCLHIENAIARGKYEGAPKSGRSREVQLSKRLRTALQEYYFAVGRPPPDRRLFPRLNDGNYRRRHFQKVCRRAADTLGRKKPMPWRPKDLRDTFASQLLTAGMPLDYIKRQLGHSSVSTTEGHYARWCSREAYREPMRLEPGEVPADLLVRLPESPVGVQQAGT